MQETQYYDAGASQQEPAAEEAEKVDTVEFAIAPHPEEPEEIAPPVQAAAQPQDDLRTENAEIQHKQTHHAEDQGSG